jgi:hypothetical protein
MNTYRVCADKDGKPLSVRLLYEGKRAEDRWMTFPDCKRHPETPKETEYVHYLSAVDEMDAYLKAQTMEKED